jgi:hypothetical protein
MNAAETVHGVDVRILYIAFTFSRQNREAALSGCTVYGTQKKAYLTIS